LFQILKMCDLFTSKTIVMQISILFRKWRGSQLKFLLEII
jgi:hypothetical protein